MVDDKNRQFSAQRNQEPIFPDVSTSGTHGTGNFRTGPDVPFAQKAARIIEDGLAWIDQDDHAKQGMARQGEPAEAEAAPDHPHVGDLQGGRQ